MENNKYPNFNDLPFEERVRIAYYTNESNIITLKQVLLNYSGDVTPNLRNKINKWIKKLEEINERR